MSVIPGAHVPLVSAKKHTQPPRQVPGGCLTLWVGGFGFRPLGIVSLVAVDSACGEKMASPGARRAASGAQGRVATQLGVVAERSVGVDAALPGESQACAARRAGDRAEGGTESHGGYAVNGWKPCLRSGVPSRRSAFWSSPLTPRRCANTVAHYMHFTV